jgi:hypothetical protein
LERDRIFSDKISKDTARNGLDALYVDGSRTADSVATEVALRFGLDR